jgi:APA family basic amino acid/polyamine antiporter
VRAAGKVQEVTTLLKIVPLAGLILLALWFALSGAPHAPDPGVPLTSGNIATAAGLTFWGFLGLESGTVPADKVQDPARNVPRATMIGVVFTGLIYLGISLAFAFYMPVKEAAASPAPVADFLGKTFGGGIAQVVALFAAISAFGALNGWILVQGEMPWAMARGGVFPAWFAKESARGIPVRGHIMSSLLLSGMALLNAQKGMGKLFEFIGSVSIAAGLVAYLLSALAALKLVRSAKTAVAAVIAAAFTLWAEWGLGFEAMGYGAALIAAGLALYPFVSSAKSSAAMADPAG